MKRILSLFLAFALAFALPAHAGRLTGTFGDKNSSSRYRMDVDTDGIVRFASDTGVLYPYQTYTTSGPVTQQLTTPDSGSVMVDFGGTAVTTAPTLSRPCSKHVLPPNYAVGSPSTNNTLGFEITLVAGAKCTVTLDTYDTNDVILYSISGTGLDAGDSIKSTGQAGDAVTVRSIGTNLWAIVDMKGSWTDNGTN